MATSKKKVVKRKAQPKKKIAKSKPVKKVIKKQPRREVDDDDDFEIDASGFRNGGFDDDDLDDGRFDDDDDDYLALWVTVVDAQGNIIPKVLSYNVVTKEVVQYKTENNILVKNEEGDGFVTETKVYPDSSLRFVKRDNPKHKLGLVEAVHQLLYEYLTSGENKTNEEIALVNRMLYDFKNSCMQHKIDYDHGKS